MPRDKRTKALVLSDKQKLFVAEYIVDFCVEAAARRAGYDGASGTSLLRKPHVQVAVREAVAKVLGRTEITLEKTLAHIARIAYAHPRDTKEWGPDGLRMKDSTKLTDEQSAAVAEVSEVQTRFGTNVHIKNFDQVAALKILMQYHNALSTVVRGPNKDGSLTVNQRDLNELSDGELEAIITGAGVPGTAEPEAGED
jgi:phage terminase small subunit